MVYELAIRRGSFSGAKELVESIESFVAAWNKNSLRFA